MRREKLYKDEFNLLEQQNRRMTFPYCGSKIQYVIKKHVESVRRQMEHVTGYFFDKYKCKYCHCWHLGHSSILRNPDEFPQKKCIECKEFKDNKEFKVRDNGRWIRSRCTNCDQLYDTITKTTEHKSSTVFGIRLEEYNELLVKQNFCCALCNCDVSQVKSSHFVVDPDETTKRVRGLLCLTCMMGLEKFNYDINLIAKVLEYLLVEVEQDLKTEK